MNKRVVIWGSYLYQGINFLAGGKTVYLSNSCAVQLKKKFEVENYSMKGLDTAKALKYIKRALMFDDKFDYALVELGQNEFINYLINQETMTLFEATSDLKNNLISIITEFFNHNVNVIINPISPISSKKLASFYHISHGVSTKINDIYKEFNNVILEIAKEYSLSTINTNTIIKNKSNYISEDGFSLNQNGHNLLSNVISKTIH